jgi:hypothetical protein
MTQTVAFDRRFRGPPDSANGGYAAGTLAGLLGGVVEVTLRRPPPLDRPLTVGREGDGLRLSDGEIVVAEAVPAEVERTVPGGAVDPDRARAATAACPLLVHPEWHPFPGCFVCGPDRAAGDGLRVFPGPIDDDGRFATTWTPGADLADDDGRVTIPFVWAGLDCPSAMGLYADARPPDAAYVLGRIAARVERAPQCGEECVVIAWRDRVDGRKLFAGSALQHADGSLLAIARATWIRLAS